MLRMRKFLTIPLAVLVLLSFAGCSNGSSSNLSSSAAASGTVSQTAPATSACPPSGKCWPSELDTVASPTIP